VANADLVVLAVKPSVVPNLLRALDPAQSARPLWVSIAAGVPLATLRAALPASARVVRTMPNTPALVGAGATAYYPGPGVEDEDLLRVEALLGAAGWAWRSPSEALLDAARAARAGHEDDHIDRLADQGMGKGGRCFLDQLFEPGECAGGGICMQRGDPARMAGIPGLEEVQRFAAAYFADNDPVRPEPHGRAHQIAECDAGPVRPELRHILGGTAKLPRIFEDDDPVL